LLKMGNCRDIMRFSHLRTSEFECTNAFQFLPATVKRLFSSTCQTVQPGEVEQIAREVPEHVTRQPRGSVLLLTDFTGASIDQEALIAIKETAVFDKPYIRKAAWVGAEHFPGAFFEDLRKFSRREFPSFETRDDALTWLAKD